MILFVLSTCLPAILIVFAALFVGPWPVMAVLSLTLMVTGLDHFVARVTAPVAEFQDGHADLLSAALAIIHLCLIPLIVWALAGAVLTSFDKACLFIASGIFFGQVSNANGHALIHRSKRCLYRLGVWTYVSLLFGHHVSAHLLIHHRFVGTTKDPSTARRGESYYCYMVRAWGGAFQLGLAAETRRLRMVQRRRRDNPFVGYLIGSCVFLVIAYVAGGFSGIAWYVALAGFAQQQLLLCDYVQHYGLTRQVLPCGRLEPVNDKHSWNAPHWYSSGMMLNAPRHSDHHAHPYRQYPALALPADGPTLPRSLPVMAVLAIFPPFWRRVMDPRVQRWQVDRAA